MRTFLCEIDSNGLRRLTPEELIPMDEVSRLARDSSRSPNTHFWTLLAEDDAEDLREDLDAGRHAEACGTLLNRAVEILSLGAAPGMTRAAC